MTIGIDASRAFLSNRTGIEEYSYRLIRHLRDELVRESVVLYVRCGQASRIDFPLPERWIVKELRARKFWTQWALAIEMIRNPPDALLVPAHTVPWIHPKRTVVVVHGLEYEVCPEAYAARERMLMRFSLRNSCRWASDIITVSESTKKDLVKIYGVPREKISVIYEGTGGEESKINSRNFGSDSSIPMSKPYFLFIGRIETRKNVARMIDAFCLFKRKRRTDHILILAGKPGFGYGGILDRKTKTTCPSDILELGYVDECEKRKLLQGADALLFPSLAEGFGLPILEAQSVGIPVLTSKISSMPEIAGECGAVFVDPSDTEDIARGIESVALDKPLRNAIISRGLRNARRFSWKKCAKGVARTLLVPNEVADDASEAHGIPN